MTLQWFHDNNINIGDSVGIDEVGRGPLAGPVVSAAVWISLNCAQKLKGMHEKMPIRDSKLLSHKQRQKVIEWIDGIGTDDLKYAIGIASVEEIDELNILNAAMLSMRRAYEKLAAPSKKIVLVDGNAKPVLSDNITNIDIRTIIKGDAKVLNISLASIIAKEHRDAIMIELSKDYPQYGWQTNVGYGTTEHLQALLDFGATPYHRQSFAPVRKARKS